MILYFSDFDPSGHQMAVSVARKIQAHVDLRFPDLKAELHHVALTLDQVMEASRRLYQGVRTPPVSAAHTGASRADDWRSMITNPTTGYPFRVRPGFMAHCRQNASPSLILADEPLICTGRLDRIERHLRLILDRSAARAGVGNLRLVAVDLGKDLAQMPHTRSNTKL